MAALNIYIFTYSWYDVHFHIVIHEGTTFIFGTEILFCQMKR